MLRAWNRRHPTIAGLAVALLASVAVARRRGRTIGRIDRLVAEEVGVESDGSRDPTLVRSVDVEDAIRRLTARAREAERALDETARDRASLIDIIGTGVVHLDEELRVDVANVAAHHLLARPPGALVGRAAIEAFIDSTIETIALAARDNGAANGELAARRDGGPTLVVRAWRSPIRGCG